MAGERLGLKRDEMVACALRAELEEMAADNFVVYHDETFIDLCTEILKLLKKADG